MLSVGAVRSAAGAAEYFAKDDYYTAENSAEIAEWGGKGAEALGLVGNVGKEDFQNLLNGKLPDGSVANDTPNRRAGFDLTFSMPKSASVLAYVTGDKRILETHRDAVKATMKWVEKNLAEARDYSRTRNGEGVRTGNLTYGMFEHDTSRKLDPQGHIHVVIAALTQTAGGKWQALWNGEIYKNMAMIGSAYHAFFREGLEKIGYQTEQTGKHGQFEITGVNKDVIQEFSQRRQDILAKVDELGIKRPEGQDRVVVNTRDAKLNVDDRAALTESWKERGAALGFDGRPLVEAAHKRSGSAEYGPVTLPEKAQAIVSSVVRVVGDYLRNDDPLTTNGLGRLTLTPAALRTEMAVASAIRIEGQREAAFEVNAIAKRALDLGLPGVTIDRIDTRISDLIRADQLVPGKTDRLDKVVTLITTPEHIAQERSLLAGIDSGRGSAQALIPAGQAVSRLLDASVAIDPDKPLTGEQQGAGAMILSAEDRTVIVQGVAGAGKSTLIQSLRDVAAAEGKQILGLAFANKTASELRTDAGIETKTVSAFVNEHLRGARAGHGETFETSRAALANTIVVLDEASLVANEPMNNLVTIANALGIDRFVMIGDKAQLLPIDNGKAFVLGQAHKPTMATLEVSQRQQTADMVAVATLTREGQFKAAFDVLGDRVQNAGEDYRQVAADKWLALSPDERSGTAIYTSGRAGRAEINELVQSGLHREGTITGEGVRIHTLQNVNATREEMRFAQTYEKGLVLDVVRNTSSSGLSRGRYEVLGANAKAEVLLKNARGSEIKFNPQKIDPKDKTDSLRLAEKQENKLHEGDKLLWTANDKERGLLNSEPAKVLNVDEHGIRVQNANGEVLDLKHGDKMLESLTLSYAINMHQAQGMTTDKAIGAMHSSERNLATQRLTHVMVTRVRQDIEIVTDDKDKLLHTISRNPGDKFSSLEVTGEIDLSGTKSSAASKAGDFAPSTQSQTQQPANRDRLAAAGLEHSQVLDLPERSIERSR